MHLKNELRSQEAEIESLKQRNLEILDINEMLHAEMQTLASMNKKNTPYSRDFDESNRVQREKLLELENLKQAVKFSMVQISLYQK